MLRSRNNRVDRRRLLAARLTVRVGLVLLIEAVSV
jgi:hypothetical protein